MDLNKRHIWISTIRDKQGLNTKIHEGKCIVGEVSTEESRKFVDENHLQGCVDLSNKSINLGLYYHDTLLQIMIFNELNYNKEYEITTLCTKKNINTQSTGNKILKYFEEKYKPKSILTYVNRRWLDSIFLNK